ncbi:PepSY-like domain-containing protein [Brachyspira innocens]|uniref:PepSY-like domain-containing protein n=1 Tax=Brachyspira innocens TaxID=13264 RepID=A0ABT8YWA8_9SPIR|nr:PepSY-like domain-containing protein [Brachyspira innocens]MDO6993072.1 PepSY-like domain-containing protein [Brachyspira innocens]MDO7019617.1 PepSY-like domain-containing protein [Brachyspira innocens]
MIKNTKLFISILFLSILQASILTAADMPIQANQLPKKAQDFISANFANDPVVYAEQDRNSFKAELQSGIEIDFDRNGDWTDVASERTPLPTKFIPANIMKAVEGKYPQVPVLEISKEYNSYKLKLGNNREVYVDNSGKIVGDKLD